MRRKVSRRTASSAESNNEESFDFFSGHEPKESQFLLEYYGELRDYVKHEDYLINFRLTWALAIHSLLFAAYGLALKGTIDAIGSATLGRPNIWWDPAVVLIALQFVVCGIGVLISYQSFTGISAAYTAIESVNKISQQSILRSQSLAPTARETLHRMILPTLTGGGSDQAALDGRRYGDGLANIVRCGWGALSVVTITGILSLYHADTAVRITDSVSAIHQLKSFIARTHAKVMNIETVEQAGQVWHVRALFHDDDREPKHRDYRADVFIRADETHRDDWTAIGP